MTNKITYILLSFLLFVGCQQEELVVEQAKGYLVFGDVEIVSEINQEQTKAEDNVSFKIKITKGTFESEIDYISGKTVSLEPGLYTVEVYNTAYNDCSNWEKDSKGEAIYYYKNEEVSITSEETNRLDIEVSMMNFAVYWKIGSFLSANFTDFIFKVYIGEREIGLSEGEKCYSALGDETFMYTLFAKNIKTEVTNTYNSGEKSGNLGNFYECRFILEGSLDESSGDN